MRMYDLILKKKQGGELSTDEIRYMIEGFKEGSIPDYQMSVSYTHLTLPTSDLV